MQVPPSRPTRFLPGCWWLLQPVLLSITPWNVSGGTLINGVVRLLFIDSEIKLQESVNIMKISRMKKSVTLLLLALLAAGCTKKADKPLQQGEAPKTLIRYATSIGNLPINFGIKKGFFAEQGLDV